MNVFSIMLHPVMIPYNDGPKTKNVAIRPGRNHVDDDVWDLVKPRLTARLDKGWLRASQDLSLDLTQREKGDLLDPTPRRAHITELCAKSDPVDSGLIPGTDGDYRLAR